ncbi:MAG: hypothetical protein ACR2QJ_04200, partial [Geminicoccaceae bacterium]
MSLDVNWAAIGGLFAEEDFDVLSSLRHHACLLPLVMIATACSPTGDGGTPAEAPVEGSSASTATEPAADTPDVVEPDVSEPVAPEPVTDEPLANEPATDVTPVEEPVIAEPEIDEEPLVPDPSPEPVELGMNDVSILLPPPTSASIPVLNVSDLAFNGAPVWSDGVFAQFLAIANSEAGAVAGEDVQNNTQGARIDISDFADKAAWHVASIRIDPGAPGLSPDIAEVFGQAPQIRLVLQPVTAGNVVQDVAAHLVYSYVAGAERVPGCPLPRLIPDSDKFRTIVDDASALKAKLAAGDVGDQPVDTGGVLGVHPAADPAKASASTQAAFRDELGAFLERHLDPAKLRAMAIMALPAPNPEPWIFLAMAPEPGSGNFVPLPSPALAQDKLRFAQMLDVRRSASVSPAVRANNLEPITCRFELPANPDNPDAPKSPDAPRGVATADLFPNSSAAEMREVVSVIADPTQSHFFNTDCVSCHTETRREMDILNTDEIDTPVDPAVLPTEL